VITWYCQLPLADSYVQSGGSCAKVLNLRGLAEMIEKRRTFSQLRVDFWDHIKSFWRRIRLVKSPLSSCSIACVLRGRISLECSAQEVVPEAKEGLGEVILDTPGLMVNIVEGGVVSSKFLEWVPWECISAVVIDDLQGSKSEEPDALTVGHSGKRESNGGTNHIQDEGLSRVGIKSAVAVRHVQTVVMCV
jgi:hypothetical protein